MLNTHFSLSHGLSLSTLFSHPNNKYIETNLAFITLYSMWCYFLKNFLNSLYLLLAKSAQSFRNLSETK